jgi:hypothetical protein
VIFLSFMMSVSQVLLFYGAFQYLILLMYLHVNNCELIIIRVYWKWLVQYPVICLGIFHARFVFMPNCVLIIPELFNQNTWTFNLQEFSMLE